MHSKNISQFDPKEREHVEIYYKNEWLQGVFYEKDEAEVYAQVQILNHPEPIKVPINKIRKFQGSSDLEFYYNFSCLFLGVGIFSLPNTMKEGSMFPSIVFMGLTLSVVYLTCYRVLHTAEKYCVDNLGNALTIMFESYSPWVAMVMKWTTTVFVWISTILCLIGYYTVIYTQGIQLYDDYKEMWWISSAILCGLLSLMPVHLLGYTSSITIGVTIIIVINMAVKLGENNVSNDVSYVEFTKYKGYFQVISGVMMATCIQYMVPSIYRTMQFRDVNRANMLMLWSHMTAFGIYVTFCIIAYLNYGNDVEPDILESMSGNDWFTITCRVAAMLCCLFISPLIFLTMADEVEGWVVNYYLNKKQNAKVNQNVVMGLKCFLIVVPALFAYLINLAGKKLNFINHINGVTVLFWFATIMNYICSENDKRTLMGKLDIALLVIMLGVTVGCAVSTPSETS